MANGKISSINVRIRLQELDGTLSSIVRLFDGDENAKKNTFVSAKIENIRTLGKDFNTAILQNKVMSNLSEKDDKRDKAFDEFCTAVNAYANLPVPALSAKALPVKEVCDKYKKANLTNVSFVSESSQLESFFTDIAPFSSNIEELEGLSDKLSAVKDAQAEFATAYDEYIKSLDSKKDAATNFKKPILDALNKELFPFLNAMMIAKDADLASFSSDVATLVEKINDQVKQHGKN